MISYFYKAVRRNTINCVVHLSVILVPYLYLSIILLPNILRFPLPEVTALISRCCCIVVGLRRKTDSETALGNCSTRSSAATARAPEVPRKNAEKRHSHCRILTIECCFLLKENTATKDLLLLVTFRICRTQ